MQIVFHLGSYFTDEDRLVKCLLKNQGVLSKEGIAVPGPAKYRRLLRKASYSLGGLPASQEVQDTLLDSALEGTTARRIVFSQPGLLCAGANIVRDGTLYDNIGARLATLEMLFPQATCEYHIAMRNPATLLPAAVNAVNSPEFSQEVAALDPRSLRWADVIARILGDNPGKQITVWCNEDTPLIWPQVLREVSGHAPGTVLKGTGDLLESLMSADGAKRMNGYLTSHPPASEAQRRRIVAAFLDKFGLEEALEMELDLPGWDAALVDEVTAQYDADTDEIEAMPGVNFIAP